MAAKKRIKKNPSMMKATAAQKKEAALSMRYNLNPNATTRAAIKNAKAGMTFGTSAKKFRLTSSATPAQSRMLNERGRTSLRLDRAAKKK